MKKTLLAVFDIKPSGATSGAYTLVLEEVDGKRRKLPIVIGMHEAQSNALAGLPEETDHKDLVAQLGARLMLDALDTDQRDATVADRSISQEEWLAAAQEMSGAAPASEQDKT